MLRTLLALLLAANLATWSWTQGWLEPLVPAPGASEREPARLTSQVRAEAVKVVSPVPTTAVSGRTAAPAATAAAGATTAAPAAGDATAAARCIEAGPYGLVDATAAEAALEAGGFVSGSWQRDMRGPAQIWLRVPRADAAQREKLQSLAAAHAALAGGFKTCGVP